MEYSVDIEEIQARRRRNKLRQLIDEYGSQAKFIAATEENQGAISSMLKGTRVFGTKKARALEKKTGKPPGWFDDDPQSIPNSPPETYLDRLTADEMRLMNAYRSTGLAGKLKILDVAESAPPERFDDKSAA